MKMLKLWFTLAVLCAGLGRAQDYRTRAYINAVLGDSVTVMKDIVKDTAAAVRSTVRGEIVDSSLTLWNDSIPTIRGEMIDSTLRVVNDSTPVWRGEMEDSARAAAGDSIATALRKDGTVALTGNWAAGDFDGTGFEKLEADTVDGTDCVLTTKITTNRGGLATLTVDATGLTVGSGSFTGDSLDAQHVVADINIVTDSLCFDKLRCNPTATIIDSFKLNVAADTLFFYIGVKKYAAKAM